MTSYCGAKPAFQIDQNWPELITNGSKMNDFYKAHLEKDSVKTDQIRTQASKQGRTDLQKISIVSSSIAAKKGGNEAGYDGFKKILGTKIHVAADKTGLLISVRTSPVNEHDSTKFIDVLEDISELAGDNLGRAIASAYAGKGYDAKYIRDYLRCHGISCRIPYKKSSKKIAQNRNQKHHGKTRFVAERFLAWPKCGFHRTAVGYERNCENYLGFAYLACIMMYWRVLG